jgi:hypothetical protein
MVRTQGGSTGARYIALSNLKAMVKSSVAARKETEQSTEPEQVRRLMACFPSLQLGETPELPAICDVPHHGGRELNRKISVCSSASMGLAAPADPYQSLSEIEDDTGPPTTFDSSVHDEELAPKPSVRSFSSSSSHTWPATVDEAEALVADILKRTRPEQEVKKDVLKGLPPGVDESKVASAIGEFVNTSKTRRACCTEHGPSFPHTSCSA